MPKFNESDHPRDEQGRFSTVGSAATYLADNHPQGMSVWTSGPLGRETKKFEYSLHNPNDIRKALASLEETRRYEKMKSVHQETVEAESGETEEEREEREAEEAETERKEKQRIAEIDARIAHYEKTVEKPAAEFEKALQTHGLKFTRKGGDLATQYFYVDHPGNEDSGDYSTIRIGDHPQAQYEVRGKMVTRGGMTSQGEHDATTISVAPGEKNLEDAIAYISTMKHSKPAQDARRKPQYLAMDGTARSFDKSGHMHISRSHISKAGVNEYLGKEVPGWQQLGLQPDRLYKFFRDPEELKKAASTFARKPILSRHIPVTASNPSTELQVGTIGSDVEFNDPFLDADLTFWDAEAIAGIESDTLRELSSAYFWKPEMIAGEYKGERYDGRMTEIEGNHLATVETGRAGPDILAADSKPGEVMKKKTKLGIAMIASLGAMSDVVAQDATLETLLGGVTKKSFKKDRQKLIDGVLAMDAECDKKKVEGVMDAVADVEDDPKPTRKEDKKLKPAEDEDDDDEDDDVAEDEDPDEETEAEKKERLKKEAKKREEKSEAAMDSKIAILRAGMRDATEARQLVRPVVGDVDIAMDSADEIYNFALDHMKVDRKGVTGTANLRALFNVANTATPPAPAVAMDAKGMAERFPNARRFRYAG